MTGTAPARVIAIEPDFAIVELAGHRRHALCALLDQLQPGDWVLMTEGHIVGRAPGSAADVQARAVRLGTGLDLERDLEDERHHYPTEDPEVVRPYR
ncbi:MAG: HypC/HybG/HupF family hydrogenase formation chaperone [Chloroflexota bacterium]